MQLDVIITNHNYGRYLLEAIDSALGQTHPVVKVIVVDDGSTDGSIEIIRSYGSRIVPVLMESGGQAAAINAGLAVSGGDAVIFLDADDVLLPTLAERVVAEFGTRPASARIHYRMEIIDADGRRTGRFKPEPRLMLPVGDLHRQVLTFPSDGVWLPTSGNAFAASALREICPVPEDDYAICADWYLVHLAALVGPVGAVDDVGALYRSHGSNNHESEGPILDLSYLRRTIRYASVTRKHLELAARRFDLTPPAEGMASMSDVGNRMICLKLDREHRAESADSLRSLLRLGVRAARNRFDTSWSFRLLFVLWLLALASAPRRLARSLGELFVLPESRGRMSGIVRATHWRHDRGGRAACGS